MHTDSGMTGISLSGYMPYMTVASLEMSDEPFFVEYPFLKRNFGKLAIGQSINFTSSRFISLSISL